MVRRLYRMKERIIIETHKIIKERETEGGRWKEGRREGRKGRRKGTTGVASTADQEKSWIGG